jgi:hypothetical protein
MKASRKRIVASAAASDDVSEERLPQRRAKWCVILLTGNLDQSAVSDRATLEGLTQSRGE